MPGTGPPCDGGIVGVIAISADWGDGIDTAIGASIGGALARPRVAVRLRRLAQEASGYLDEGEKQAAPVAFCTRGGRILTFTGLAIFIPFAMISIADTSNVILGGLTVGWLLALVGVFLVAHRHALALTDRRLIVFRLISASGRRIPARHIQDIFIAAPLSDVSTGFKKRLGWGFFGLEFAPATGQAPIQLDFWSVDTLIAAAIHQALATTAAKGPGSSELPAGTNSWLLGGGTVMATSASPPGGGGEAYAVAPVAVSPAKLRPGRVWYWVALAVFLAGVAWAAVAFIVIIGQVDSFQRVPFPGTGVISLARGGYVVYYEGPGSSSGGDVPQGHVDVVPVSESAAVGSMALYSGSVTYQFGSHSGTAILTLQITGPGTFRVRSTASEALPGSQLAFGSSVAGWIVVAAVGASVLILAGIAGAIVVAIIRHRRAKRA